MHLLSYVRVKEERPGKKSRRAHILLFLSLALHLGLTRLSRHWVEQLGEEKRRQCGDFWIKTRPKFFCINSVRRFFLLKCVQHTCVAFRSLFLMSNLGLLGYCPNRSFLFYFVSAYLCDQWDGEAEVQSMKAEFKWQQSFEMFCLLSPTFHRLQLWYTSYTCRMPQPRCHVLTVIYCMYNIRVRLVHLYFRNVNN